MALDLNNSQGQVFGPSGANHAPGLVPDPGSSSGSTRFLREDATWDVPAGGGGGGITALTGDVTASGSGSVPATIAAGAVTLAKMANLAADSVIGNNTGSPATPIALTQAQLTALVNVATTSASGAVSTLPNDATKFFDGTGNFSHPAGLWTPGGRLSNQSGNPSLNVVGSSVLGATSHFYVPYIHQFVPIWNGSQFVMTDIGGQLTQTLADTTKSPAAAVANGVYDILVWNDSGTLRATRSAAWASSSSRGAGVGTAEQGRTNGVLVNAQAVTNGPPAGFGTYVGTIGTNASGTLDFGYGGSASGGTTAFFGVWNMYNRIRTFGFSTDNGATYTYSTSTVRPVRNSTSNAIFWVDGQGEDVPIVGMYHEIGFTANLGASYSAGFGLNSTTSFFWSAFAQAQGTGAETFDIVLHPIQFISSIGRNSITALEKGDGTHAISSFFSNIQLSFPM